MKTTNVSGIYIISNLIDDRVYVGSAVSLAHRKGTHFFQLKNNKHCNSHLQNFVNKYGLDKLRFNVIELCDISDLIKREQFWFSKFEYKFNIALFAGSTLGRVYSEDTKRKISNSLKKAGLKGIPKSEETKLAMRKPKSKEHILKIKNAQKAVIKKVYQYDLEMNFIKEFESISESAIKTGFNRQQISACCNNKQNTVKGFIFCFNKITINEIEKYKYKIKNTLKYIKK